MTSIRKASIPLAVLMLLTVGCASNANGGSTETKELLIGSVHSLTGPLSALGEATQGGLQLEATEINNAGGVVIGKTHYMVKLVNRDDQSNASTAAAAALALIRDDAVKFLFGPDATQTAGPVQAVAAQHGVAFFSIATQVIQSLSSGPSTPANKFTIGVGSPISDWVQAGVASVKKLAPNTTKVALLLESSASFDPWISGYQAAFAAAGIHVSIALRYDATTTNFLTLLTRIKAENVDAVVAGNSSVPIQAIAAQMSALGGVANVLYGTGGAANICLTANDGKPVGFSCAYLVPGGNDVATGLPSVKDWFDTYTKVIGKPAPANFAHAAPVYATPLKMLVAAMEKVGSVTDTSAVINAFLSMTGQSPGGQISFNANHQISQPMAVCSTTGGTTVKCEAVAIH